jgi:hypothetical protein
MTYRQSDPRIAGAPQQSASTLSRRSENALALAARRQRKREAAQFARTPPARSMDRMLEFAIAGLLYGWAVKETIGTTQIVGLGFYTFHIIDIPIAMLALYCAASIKYITQVKPSYLLLFLVPSTILFANSILGLTYKSAQALLDIRYWYALVFVPLAAILCPEPALLLTRCRRYAIHAAVFMTMLVYLRLATTPNLFFVIDIAAGDVNDGGRGLSSQGATSVLVSFWLTFIQPAPATMRDKLRINALRAFLLSGVALSLQGTTSIAAALTLAIFVATGYRPLRLPGIVILPIFALVCPLVLPSLLDLVFGAEFVAHRLDNELTRKLIWQAFSRLFDGQSLLIRVFGWPFGQMPTLSIHYRGASTPWFGSIHNMYLGGLRGMGYAGNVTLLFAMFVLLVRYLYTFMRQDAQGYLIMSFIMITILISFYSYEATEPIALAMLWPILAARIRNVG